MTGYFLAGILATACVSLWLLHRRNERDMAALEARYEGRIELLQREKKELLHTALEANRVAFIDPHLDAARNVATAPPMALMRQVQGSLARLEQEDAQKAQDRDARIAQEMEDRKREAEGTRGMRPDAN